MIYQGNALQILKTLNSESIDCVVTSPPYWALRDYGVEGQLGLEPTFQEYIIKLCNIFDEVKRVLKKSGTCWVNMGDSFGSGKGEKGIITKAIEKKKPVEGFQKCLLQIPARFSIEMCNRSWILRNTLIWHKPNCMPSSVRDRFTVDFEYVFFFVKNKKYWFKKQFEPYDQPINKVGVNKKLKTKALNTFQNKPTYNDFRKWYETEIISSKFTFNRSRKGQGEGNSLAIYYAIFGRNDQGRNKRCVWKITTKPFKEAHFAVFPETLVETPIKAGCPMGGIVLDPFCGSGTTCVVAKKLNRNYVGIELNPEYIKMAEKRILNTQKSLL